MLARLASRHASTTRILLLHLNLEPILTVVLMSTDRVTTSTHFHQASRIVTLYSKPGAKTVVESAVG
jgi:hypothetical protein